MRTTALFALIIATSLLFNASPSAQESDYQENRPSLADDIREYALDYLLTGADADDMLRALDDVMKFSTGREDDQLALEAVEALIEDLEADASLYTEAQLMRGRLLKRVGRDQESRELFEFAVAERWQHAMWRYSESFIDAGELDNACVLEYQRVVGEGNYGYYRGEKEDFFIFITLLRLMKNANPIDSAVERVANRLRESREYPMARQIALALCLAEDQRYGEAIDLLKNLDSTLTSSPASILDEKRNVPLYITAVLLYEGLSMRQAEAWYEDFLERNRDDYRHVYEKSMRVVRDLTISVEFDLHKAKLITRALIESAIVEDDGVRPLFTPEEIAGIYDMHQQSLGWSADYQECMVVSQFATTWYYPHTLAGANCAMNLAYYNAYFFGEVDEAIKRLTEILEESPFDEIKPWANLAMAKVLQLREERESALPYLEEVLRIIGPSAQGTIVRCRDEALELIERLTN